MTSLRVPACFMRGGSSKGVFFSLSDLPQDRSRWDRLFLSVIGSPDPYARQLNGMGGGVSSLSKVAVISPSERDDADLDFTFGQVDVGRALVDYSSNCGNLSSAVGPFALECGLIRLAEGQRSIRIHNTNTNKILVAYLSVEDGLAAEKGNVSIPGVAGTGAPIRLQFLDPAGAGTGSLLPTGRLVDEIRTDDGCSFSASLMDAGNPCVFIDATSVGRTANEPVAELEGDRPLMDLLDTVRRKAAVKMGLAASEASAPDAVPKIAIVGPPGPANDLAGNKIDPTLADLSVRMLSMKNVHRVLPLTGAMCTSVACCLPGTIPASLCKTPDGDVRLANPSGILHVGADVTVNNAPEVQSVTVVRTARLLMKGEVAVPV